MPRLLAAEPVYPAPALLALRRTLWQLAMLGIAGAVAICALADVPGVLPAWLLLAPISALLAHHRASWLALLRTAADANRTSYPRRRLMLRQAIPRSIPISRQRVPRPIQPIQHMRRS